MASRTRRNRQRGQALVESAFITLVFVVTLLGIFDLGQILFIHQSLADRARNAARYAVVRTYDATVVQNMVLYYQPTVPEGATTGFMGLATSMVSVTRSDAGTNEDRITITISNYPFRFFSPLIAGQFYGRPIVVTMPTETV
ncbi:MAG: TadE family protein [Acidobacteriota bacterium]